MNGANIGTACMWEAYRWFVIAGSVSAVVILPLAYFVVVIDGDGHISRILRRWRYPGIEETGE